MPETPTPVFTDPPPRENTAYDCEESGHIFGKWFPYSGPPRFSVYRSCVIPGCSQTHVKAAKA